MAVRRVDCAGPGIQRRRAGRGFTYRTATGRRLTARRTLDRIRALAIPPAWEDVWICPDANGHIQATGIDAKGRRQYRYHEAWTEERAQEKHDRVLELARRLPELREQVRADLALEGMPRPRVLACAVALLQLGCFRVGGESYAEENGSFGLATLQKRHVRIRSGVARFEFDSKSGQRQRFDVTDPAVVAVLTTLRRRRCPAEHDLLAYKDDDDRWVDVRSQDINDYLQEHLGHGFSSKDFRTWVGTVLAAVVLAVDDDAGTDAERRRSVVTAVQEVAAHLGNTAAVARSAYIDPRVIERYEADDILEDPEDHLELEAIEAEVIALVERAEPD